MSDDADLEREIRSQRQFTLAEAIGRLAGPGGLKGASPVGRRQQAQGEVAELVKRHLRDPAGALARVLAREVGEGRALLDAPDRPQAALAAHVRATLASDYQLDELVRMADVAWGETYGERPYFEREGRPSHPDDPYTRASVREALSRLLAALGAG